MAVAKTRVHDAFLTEFRPQPRNAWFARSGSRCA
jgi:hypothetical protein